jgi:hypothetical protein
MWFTRPENGHKSMLEIDVSLKEIRRNRRRVCVVIAKLVEETEAGERKMKQDAPNPGHT